MVTADAIINDDARLARFMRAAEHLYGHAMHEKEINAGDIIPGTEQRNAEGEVVGKGLRVIAVASKELVYSQKFMRGYEGWVVEDEEGNHFIMHDNTDRSDRSGDLMTDAQILNDHIPRQVDFARQFTEYMREKYYDGKPMTHIGHSLGGALSLMVAAYTDDDQAVAIENLCVGRQIEHILDETNRTLEDFQGRAARIIAINENGVPNAVSCGLSYISNTHMIELPIQNMDEREPPYTTIEDENGNPKVVINARRLTHPKGSEERALQEDQMQAWKRAGHRIANLPAQLVTGQRMFGFPAWTALSHNLGILSDALDAGHQRMTYEEYREKFSQYDVDIDRGQAATYRLYLQDGKGGYWETIKEAKNIEEGSWRNTMFNAVRNVEGIIAGLLSGSWRGIEKTGDAMRAFIDGVKFIFKLTKENDERYQDYKEMQEGSIFARFMDRLKHTLGFDKDDSTEQEHEHDSHSEEQALRAQTEDATGHHHDADDHQLEGEYADDVVEAIEDGAMPEPEDFEAAFDFTIGSNGWEVAFTGKEAIGLVDDGFGIFT